MKDMSRVREKNRKQFLDKALSVHGSLYDYSHVDYVGSQIKVRIGCDIHGPFNQTPAEHLRGSGCPACAGNVKLTTGSVLPLLRRHFSDPKYSFDNVAYTNGNTAVQVTCATHGDFDVFVRELEGSDKECPSCRKDARLLRHYEDHGQKFVEQLASLLGPGYSFEKTVYRGAHSTVTITCNVHGDFERKAYTLGRASACTACGMRNSSQQTRVANHFDSTGLQVLQNFKMGGIEYDIFFPQANLAVEVNGVYWHTERFRRGRDYHLNKTLAAKEQGVRLLHFLDLEVDTKFDTVVSMIGSALGMLPTVGARSCTVATVTSRQAIEFFDQNHLQGGLTGSLNLGLEHEGCLVAVMSFRTPRWDTDSEWELLRFASLRGLTIVGGASRLLAHFQTETKATSIVSYANLRYSYGAVYRSMGFRFSHRAEPGYVYVKGGVIVSRHRAQKQKLERLLRDYDPELSERENMQRNGYYRMWDCGNLVYKKEWK